MLKKIYFVINSLEGGGAERVLSNLANNFSTKGYQVTLVCFNTAEVKYEIYSSCRLINLVNRVGKPTLFNRMKYAWLTFFRLFNLLRKEKPDYTICFMTTANLWAGLCCMVLKLPYLVSERITPDYTINRYNKMMQWLSAQVYRKSKAIVLPAANMLMGFKRNDYFKELTNFKTIHNPIHIFTIKKSIKVHPKNFILGVGRLDKQKGFDMLINAYHLLLQNDVDLLISGEGEERENLQRQILDLGLSNNVKLIGFKSNLQDYYTQAEVFVLSSRNEGYPNVLVEAMGLGCACVAMNCEFGPSEIIINGVNGILVPDQDERALAKAVSVLLNNTFLKNQFSEKARLINETNSIEQISLDWEKLILS